MAASTATSSLIVAKGAFAGSRQQFKAQKAVPAVQKFSVVASAEEDKAVLSNRRAALSLFAAGTAAVAAKPSFAAYGEGANVFGRATNTSGFVTFAGDGYAILVPSKFNTSKEKEFPGTDARWESNFRVADTLIVTVNDSDKGSITDYGSPEEFLSSIGFMLGTSSFFGETKSEGGFKDNTVSASALLDVNTKEKNGKTYYEFELLTRTADGDEGGRHALFSAAVSGGKLYVAKFQAGDKSWFKGLEIPARTTMKSFTVA